jgi:S-DNA-T family DNA segregation ATPase FtsK/SpoIIIE
MSARTGALLDNYFKHRPLQSDYDYRELEETALNGLLKLSAQCADPVIDQIQSEYRTAKHTIETSFQKIKDEHDKHYQFKLNELQQHFQEQTDVLKERHGTQKHSLLTRTKNEKEKSVDDIEIQHTKFKANFDYEIMIADIVEKASLKRLQQKAVEVRDFVSAAKAQFDQLREHAARIVSFYHVRAADYPSTNPAADIGGVKAPTEFFERQRDTAEIYLHKLSQLSLPKVFLTAWCYAIFIGICGLSIAAGWLLSANMAWTTSELAVILPVGLAILAVILIILGKMLRKKARAQLLRDFGAIRHAHEAAVAVLDSHLQNSLEQLAQSISEAKNKHKNERGAAGLKYEQLKAALEQKSKALIRNSTSQLNQTQSELEDRFDKEFTQIKQQAIERQEELNSQYGKKSTEIQCDFTRHKASLEREYQSRFQQLKGFWLECLQTLKSLLDETKKVDEFLFHDWQNTTWSRWVPRKTQQNLIRFGRLEADFRNVADSIKELMEPDLKSLDTVVLPAVLTFPNRCSLLVQTPHKTAGSAIDFVKAVMIRLFTSVPPGLIHFNIFDPVGLGSNFVGFMHAVDYEKALVGGRIWTDAEHIQRSLTELTTHMENVIQKYLRNEFESIEAYNQQAGELAEPYRFLVIADFPTNFNDESIRRLKSIITSGPRCGVFTLIICDEGQKLPEGITSQDLAANGVHLAWQKGRFVWQNETLKQFPLEIDSPPSEELLTDLVCKVSKASIDSTRVEVPFETIAPSESDKWSLDSTFEIRIPIGRAGAKRLQYMQLGKGVNQHALIAGKTGSGKSTLFHIIITNLAQWYSPDEVELYLIDFKQGVEFKTYAAHKVPHARAVAIESDREFGLSILQKLDAEMNIRGEKFRQTRVQDISAYRRTTGEKMPRTILIVDEFHILFSEDDKIAHDSTMLLEKLVRQGRAFGIHIILGSQSLAGTSGISRSIMGQMAVRIALQCSEMDSQIILNEDNVVARLLARPGEAIYNDAGGMVVGNNPFQVAWLAKTTQDEYLANIQHIGKKLVLPHQPMIVFEGNVPANISNNSVLARFMHNSSTNYNPAKQPPRAWFGEAVTIKDPTAAVFNRQNGANLLIVGQQDLAMAGVLSSALLSLLVQLSLKAAKFIILDGSPADSLISASLKRIDSYFPQRCRHVPANQVVDIIAELTSEVQNRIENNISDSPSQFLFIAGLQRFRMLYRKEDDWSLRADEKSTSLDRQLADILREGPATGIHAIIGVDTFNTIEKVLNRQMLREFNNRVLFQMSASDSSNLIDSPVANQLGFQRALYYNEEQGILEKFRFYAPPDEKWLKTAGQGGRNSDSVK